VPDVRVPAVDEEREAACGVHVDVERLVPVEVDGAGADHCARPAHGVHLHDAVEVAQRRSERRGAEAVRAVDVDHHGPRDARSHQRLAGDRLRPGRLARPERGRRSILL